MPTTVVDSGVEQPILLLAPRDDAGELLFEPLGLEKRL